MRILKQIINLVENESENEKKIQNRTFYLVDHFNESEISFLILSTFYNNETRKTMVAHVT